jgi:FkbM family methyltransferase
MATEAPPADSSTRRRNAVRLINIALLLCLIAVGTIAVVLNWRPLHFKATGNVVVDGSTFYLQPDDNYLTQLVVRYGEYEPTETQLVRDVLKEGDVFLDVGANVGWYTVHAAKRVGPTGKVIAFEPEPSNLAMLKRNVEVNGLSNVVAEGVALSNAEGSFKLFLEKGNLGMHSLVLEHEGGKHYINVQTVRLDDYWKGKGDIKLVKIDTEGAEGMILDGMRETLKRQKGIELIVEYAPDRLKQSGYDPDKVLGDLYKLGLKASLIDEGDRRIVPLGTPRAKDVPLNPAYRVTNLYLKR